MYTKQTQGFTLIELLVVVLIIGILAAIALPQYNKAVEKSRLTELLLNVKTIENSVDLFLLENGGFPAQGIHLPNLDIAGTLQGGEFDDNLYTTKYFEYEMNCDSLKCYGELYRKGDSYAFYIYKGSEEAWGEQGTNDKWINICITETTDLGRAICKSLENQGWIYKDVEL